MWSNYTVFKGVVQPFCARVYHANVFTDAHCLWDWDDCGVVSGCVNWVLWRGNGGMGHEPNFCVTTFLLTNWVH